MLCLKILTPYKHRLSEPCRIKNCGSREEKMDKKFEKINAKKLSTEEKDQDIRAEAINKISGVAVE